MDVSLSELQEMVMVREAWRASIHGVTKCRTRLSDSTELNTITEQLYQRNSYTVKKVLGPTTNFPTWGFSKGNENLQGI